jgi:hypothetical protein
LFFSTSTTIRYNNVWAAQHHLCFIGFGVPIHESCTRRLERQLEERHASSNSSNTRTLLFTLFLLSVIIMSNIVKQGVTKTENTAGVAATAGGTRVGGSGATSSSSGSSGGHVDIGAGSSTGSRAAMAADPNHGPGDGGANKTSMRSKVAKHTTPKKRMNSDEVGGPRAAPLSGSGVNGGDVASPASTSTSGGASDSMASESADAMRIRELEAQLRSMQMAQEMMARQQEATEQQLQFFQQAQSGPQQHRPSAASPLSSQPSPSSQSRQTPPIQPTVRVSAVQPTRLSYGSAAAGSGLEDWLFSVEQLLTQMRHTEANGDDSTMIATATLYWDRPMQLWFDAEQQRVDESGIDSEPVTTWKEFKAALRRQFTPLADDFVARDELLGIRMKGGESMEAYMQRVVLLVTRAGQQIDGRTAATLTLRGVDELRFPFTVAAAKRKERESGTMGMSFAAMRAELTFGAHNEPKLNVRHGGSGNSSSSSHSSSSRSAMRGNNNSNKQLRIAALQQQLQDLQEESENDESNLITAPLTTGGGRAAEDIRCHKCGKSGHVVFECKSKTELRKCFRCNEVGHLANKCSTRRRKGVSGSAVAASSSSGAEGAPASASMSTSKNE